MRTETKLVLLLVLYGFLTLLLFVVALIVLYQHVLTVTCLPLPPSFRLLDVCTMPTAWVPFVFSSIAGVIILSALFGYQIIRILQRSIERSHAAYEKFAGTLAHDLRTPLTILTTRTEILLLDPTIESSAREAHEQTLEELSRINSLISKALVTAHKTAH